MAKRVIMKGQALNLELIEQHYEGTLTGTELEAFEKQLQEDTAFATEVNVFQNLMLGIEAAGEANFLSKVSNWEKEAKANQTPENVVPMVQKQETKVVSKMSRRDTFRYSAIAAGIIMLLFFVSRMFLPSGEQDMTADYFSPYPNVETVRGTASPLAIGMEFYDRGEYQKAAEALSKYITQRENQEASNEELAIARFYLANAQLAVGNVKEAISSFKKVIPHNATFKEVSEWYLALAYVKANDKATAMPLIETISKNSKHSKSKIATEFLGKLK